MKNKETEWQKNKETELVIMNFSHVYEQEKFYRHEKYHLVDCTDIMGTDCYCDEQGEAAIKEKIAGYAPYGIHFIDSGNYHYISKLWLDKLKAPFVLVLMDFHPDMQPSLFQNLMSCGCWVKEVLDTNPYIEKVVLLGASEELIAHIDEMYRKRIVCYNKEAMQHLEQEEAWHAFSKKHIKLPVYISIDKDVLSTEEASTNWSQGTMTLEEMKHLVRIIWKKERIIGADICGECANTLQTWLNDKENQLNDKVNYELMELFEKLLVNRRESKIY